MEEVEPRIIFLDKYRARVEGTERFHNHRDALDKHFRLIYYKQTELADKTQWYYHEPRGNRNALPPAILKSESDAMDTTL